MFGDALTDRECELLNKHIAEKIDPVECIKVGVSSGVVGSVGGIPGLVGDFTGGVVGSFIYQRLNFKK